MNTERCGADRDDEGRGNAAGVLHGGGEVTPLSQRLEAAAGGVVELAHLRAQDLAGAHVVDQHDRVRVHCERHNAVENARDRQGESQAAAAAIGRLHTCTQGRHLKHCVLSNQLLWRANSGLLCVGLERAVHEPSAMCRHCKVYRWVVQGWG